MPFDRADAREIHQIIIKICTISRLKGGIKICRLLLEDFTGCRTFPRSSAGSRRW
jgi:hypothetical protein